MATASHMRSPPRLPPGGKCQERREHPEHNRPNASVRHDGGALSCARVPLELYVFCRSASMAKLVTRCTTSGVNILFWTSNHPKSVHTGHFAGICPIASTSRQHLRMSCDVGRIRPPTTKHRHNHTVPRRMSAPHSESAFEGPDYNADARKFAAAVPKLLPHALTRISPSRATCLARAWPNLATIARLSDGIGQTRPKSSGRRVEITPELLLA